MSDDELPKYGPKEADHVSVGEKCAACRKPFVDRALDDLDGW